MYAAVKLKNKFEYFSRFKAKKKMFFKNSTSRTDKNSTANKIFHKHNLCLHYSNAKILSKKSPQNKKLHDF